MKFLYYIILVLTTTYSWGNPLLKEANKLYQTEKYAEAITVYEKVIQTNQQSVALYFNLANAHYKLNHIAPSIYYYEKALLLAPNDPDILNNLSFAKAMTIDEIKEVPEIGLTKYIRQVTSLFYFETWAWISIGCASAVLLFFVFYFYSDATKLKRFSFTAIFVWIALLAGAISAGALEKSIFINEQPAIVFANTAPVKNEPLQNAEDTFVLHEGTKVFIIEKNKNWSKIRLSDGSEGWIDSDSIKPIK